MISARHGGGDHPGSGSGAEVQRRLRQSLRSRAGDRRIHGGRRSAAGPEREHGQDAKLRQSARPIIAKPVPTLVAGALEQRRGARAMPTTEDLDEIVATVARDMLPHLGEGRVADYIPALARVDPRQFGIAIVTTDGRVASAGDAETPFSIQSLSKVFTLVLAINRLDGALWDRVGREPSGSPFNSIVQLEQEKGIPRNPFINAGALVVTDAVIAGAQPAEAIVDIAGFMRRLAMDEDVSID